MINEDEFFMQLFSITEKYENDEKQEFIWEFEKEISKFLSDNLDFLNKYKREVIDKVKVKMKVKDVIKFLSTVDQEKEVWHVWDGQPRSKIEAMWVARNGNIISGPLDECVYSEEYRPNSAPFEKEDGHWEPRDNLNLVSTTEEKENDK